VLRVATFNIRNANGMDGVVDLERVARVVTDHRIDVIGLQEVDRHLAARSEFRDQARDLSELLGWQNVYGANVDLEPAVAGQPRRQYGNALMSRLPVADAHNLLLPRPAGGEQRGLLSVRVFVAGRSILVMNTHLQHNSQLERLAQATRLREHLAHVQRPFVLMGDLNATPEQPETAAIRDGLVDAWSAVGVGDGFTFSSVNPHKRIDYILHSYDVRTLSAFVVPSAASDHLPLVVDLDLRAPAGTETASP
jgi:endonuclease/exonuclease/phosphatase family metal-dependent hydrolase